MRLQVDSPGPDFRHYAPYYFWFLQGEPQAQPVIVRNPLDVVFDSHLRLLGYDLAQPTLNPGETLSVTLYWRATAPVASAAKVFVHLYDAQGRLGAQVDGWPVDGTRPPYTWSVGEVIRDRQQVLLPLELPPGRYSLLVGLYDREGRLVASSATPQPFSENRVPLAEIEIRSQ